MSEENEGLDSTTSLVGLVENGSDDEVCMLLGGRDRIRPAGVVRSGKQVPKKSCTAQEKALFEKLEAEGLSYDDINRAMGGKPKSKESKLTMTNMDHFVIRSCDFKKESDVDFILKNYADKDGFVRRLPIFFTVSDIDKAVVHGFTGFNGSGQLRCKSFYDGNDLKFKYIEKSVVVPKATDWKILDSDDQDEATKACGYEVNFSVLYRFNVVGLRGIGECICPNRSWNGTSDAVSVLQKVKKRLGRIDGLLNGSAFFELVKVQEFVKHEGKRVKQSLVTIELSVDPMEIERYAEPSAVVARSVNAMSLLTGRRPSSPAVPVSPPDAHPVQQFVQGHDADAPVTDESATAHASASGTVAATPETKAIALLTTLVASHSLFLADMETLYAAEHRGEELSGATIDELRAFYGAVQASLKSGADIFVDTVKSMRNP